LTRPRAANVARRVNGREQAHDAESAGRILLVEDEALVAIMMADLLRGKGYAVVGPLATVADALEPAYEATLDAALLDVTLGRERIYPVAEVLAARGIPFAFLTGYGRDGIDPKFAAAPVLQKPVDEAALDGFLSTSLRRAGLGAMPPIVSLSSAAPAAPGKANDRFEAQRGPGETPMIEASRYRWPV
jgi:CheY-like chemotaxis protein